MVVAGLVCVLAFVLASLPAWTEIVREASASPAQTTAAAPDLSDLGAAGVEELVRRAPAAPVRTDTREATERTPIEPTRVLVPSIGVDAEVIRLGLNPDRTLEVPSDFSQAGWWTGGSMPGEDGPAVVAGHVDSRSGPAVFFRLRELTPGDIITLADDEGQQVRFVVDRVEQHPKDDFPTDAVYGPTEEPTLRLITCGGSFDRSVRSYRDNIVVFATLAEEAA